jgi:hypothetical protein
MIGDEDIVRPVFRPDVTSAFDFFEAILHEYATGCRISFKHPRMDETQSILTESNPEEEAYGMRGDSPAAEVTAEPVTKFCTISLIGCPPESAETRKALPVQNRVVIFTFLTDPGEGIPQKGDRSVRRVWIRDPCHLANQRVVCEPLDFRSVCSG